MKFKIHFEFKANLGNFLDLDFLGRTPSKGHVEEEPVSSAQAAPNNEEVGHLGGVIEPRNKSCVSYVHNYYDCSCSSYPHYFVEDMPINLWCVGFEKFSFQIYFLQP
jgi:hypothetical protein